LFDSDMAVIYRVETKRVHEAVENNPDKFPDGCIMELDKNKWDSMKLRFSTSLKGDKVKRLSEFIEKRLVYTCHNT